MVIIQGDSTCLLTGWTALSDYVVRDLSFLHLRAEPLHGKQSNIFADMVSIAEKYLSVLFTLLYNNWG